MPLDPNPVGVTELVAPVDLFPCLHHFTFFFPKTPPRVPDLDQPGGVHNLMYLPNFGFGVQSGPAQHPHNQKFQFGDHHHQ